VKKNQQIRQMNDKWCRETFINATQAFPTFDKLSTLVVFPISAKKKDAAPQKSSVFKKDTRDKLFEWFRAYIQKGCPFWNTLLARLAVNQHTSRSAVGTFTDDANF